MLLLLLTARNNGKLDAGLHEISQGFLELGFVEKELVVVFHVGCLVLNLVYLLMEPLHVFPHGLHIARLQTDVGQLVFLVQPFEVVEGVGEVLVGLVDLNVQFA
jgi:hypothetical protein